MTVHEYCCHLHGGHYMTNCCFSHSPNSTNKKVQPVLFLVQLRKNPHWHGINKTRNNYLTFRVSQLHKILLLIHI
ncbi:hypothetical protein HanXRQr2_Chr03g0135551 [Helianthus annuus]|uniref:Uncharacterized protein n=1 Tax=Helianthus annuus TaxID=4232 RepID=A0A9K3JL00_HELAN|nr:hypothetical protein HanXRQr2_Chr03g0135551 [Helianthus annuus]KAJ0945799.1 hypothetical protein HanPSC8_Chr03g0132121 [Helianthus annuus]